MIKLPIIIHENGDVLSGPENTVIASQWSTPLGMVVSISEDDLAEIVALANRTAQLEAHLVAVCNALEGVMHRHETERGREPLIAARAFLKQEKP